MPADYAVALQQVHACFCCCCSFHSCLQHSCLFLRELNCQFAATAFACKYIWISVQKYKHLCIYVCIYTFVFAAFVFVFLFSGGVRAGRHQTREHCDWNSNKRRSCFGLRKKNNFLSFRAAVNSENCRGGHPHSLRHEWLDRRRQVRNFPFFCKIRLEKENIYLFNSIISLNFV